MWSKNKAKKEKKKKKFCRLRVYDLSATKFLCLKKNLILKNNYLAFSPLPGKSDKSPLFQVSGGESSDGARLCGWKERLTQNRSLIGGTKSTPTFILSSCSHLQQVKCGLSCAFLTYVPLTHSPTPPLCVPHLWSLFGVS